MAMLIACSAKGSPGVTTSVLALGLQWPSAAIVASADPAGDDLRAGILQAAAPGNRGLLDLALSLRRGAADVAAHAVCLAVDGRSTWVLPGITDPQQMDVLAPHWPAVTTALLNAGRDVLVDCGRVSANRLPAPLVERAALVAVVLRPSLLGVDRARPLVAGLTRELGSGRSAAEIGVLCVGDAPYQPDEVARALEVPLLGVLPYDTGAAGRLADGEVLWRRPLLRAGLGVASSMSRRMSRLREAAVVAS